MPYRFVPLGANAGLDEIRRAANANFAQLDGELVTKTYKQPGGNAIVQGKLPGDLGYGTAYYNSDNDLVRVDTADQINFYDPATGKNFMRIGRLPDGTYGWDIAAEGYDVEDVYDV